MTSREPAEIRVRMESSVRVQTETAAPNSIPPPPHTESDYIFHTEPGSILNRRQQHSVIRSELYVESDFLIFFSDGRENVVILVFNKLTLLLKIYAWYCGVLILPPVHKRINQYLGPTLNMLNGS